MGIVAASAHHIGNTKSATNPNTAKVSQKIFRSTASSLSELSPIAFCHVTEQAESCLQFERSPFAGAVGLLRRVPTTVKIRERRISKVGTTRMLFLGPVAPRILHFGLVPYGNGTCYRSAAFNPLPPFTKYIRGFTTISEAAQSSP